MITITLNLEADGKCSMAYCGNVPFWTVTSLERNDPVCNIHMSRWVDMATTSYYEKQMEARRAKAQNDKIKV